MTLLVRFEQRLKTWGDSCRACWLLFLEVNTEPDLLPRWPQTAIGRLLWTPIRWLGSGMALVTGAAMGALLGVDADRDVESVYDQLPELFGLVAKTVGVAAAVYLVGWVYRFFVYAGTKGAHKKGPGDVALLILVYVWALFVFVWLVLGDPL